MDLMPSEEQEEIAATVASLLTTRLPVEALSSTFVTDGSEIAPDVWCECCELGWLALGLPEVFGGVGYGLPEETTLFRELGRGVAPGPFLPGVLAAHLAAAAGDEALVAAIASGETRVALGTVIGDATVGDDVSGEFFLAHIDGASLVLIANRVHAAVVAVDQLEIEPIDAVEVTVSQARGRCVNAPAVMAEVGSDVAISTYSRGLVLAAAMATGVAEGATHVVVEYAKERVQFGKPIGTFQAIKHRCADMAAAAAGAFAQVCFAAVALQDGASGGDREAATAKYAADEAARAAGDGSVHMHGAIGFTSETTPHRYVYRAHLLGRLLAQRAQLLDMIIGRDEPTATSG